MKQLLDTHTFLWFVMGSPRLSDAVKMTIEDENIENYLSIASLWEISIKFSLGKLTLGMPYEVFIRQEVEETSLIVLNISLEHLNVLTTLPFHHRDPFDRLIISQSIVEKIRICSIDKTFDSYPISRFW